MAARPNYPHALKRARAIASKFFTAYDPATGF
jgi:hypothetical protein